VAILLLLACSSFGQTVYTPEKGSPERKEILDTLRVPVVRELKQKIVFAAETFNVLGSWTFIYGTMQTPEGGQPDFSKTKYARAQRDGFFGNNFQALLKRTSGKWSVVKYQIGCTDVCYTGWWKQYRAPKAVFPYTE
ncbi:MAG: hypothetical protein ACRD43_09480, partial [Pyrinomonadaceae bacterium]